MSEDKPKHPTSVEGWNGTLEELAIAVGRMRYDKFAEFLGHLADYVNSEGEKDAAGGKTKLPRCLYAAADRLYGAQKDIDSAWEISEPYMKDNNTDTDNNNNLDNFNK